MEQEAAQAGTTAVAQAPQIGLPDSDTTPTSASAEGCVGEGTAEAGRTGIETTAGELKAFEIVKGQFERSSLSAAFVFDSSVRKEVPASLSYKDTTGYFGIYFNKPAWWVMRLYLAGRKNWVAFNVSEEIGAQLIPEGMIRLEVHPFGNFRIQVTSPEDLERLHRLVFAAFEKTINDRLRSKGTNERSNTPTTPAAA